MYNRGKKWLIAIILLVLVVAITVVGVFDYRDYIKKQEKEYEVASQTEHSLVYYEGEAYKYNSDIQNILFMGIDQDTEIHSQNIPGTNGQADCIFILSVDRQAKTGKILQIARDSMTEIDIYDSNGNYYTSMEGQLALQYAYGSGAKNSCWAMKKTVREFLYDLPISGYVAMDIAAVSELNDLLGGVTITVPEDYTLIDPSLVKGQTIVMDGELAEKYVRYRDVNEAGSSHARMRRQVQYIPALLETFQQEVGDDSRRGQQIYESISQYLLTDLSPDEIEEFQEYKWDMENIVYLEGEIVQGEEFEEFHVNRDALQKKLIELYYKQK